VPIWARLIVAIASARVAVGLVLFLAGQVNTARPSPIPVWAYALLSVTFALVGGGLVVGNKRDARAAWLGGMLVLLAVPLSERLLVTDSGPLPTILTRLRPDTFLAAFLWRFVGAFPSEILGRAGGVVRVVARLLEVIGGTAFVLMLSTVPWPLTATDPRVLLHPVVAQRGSLYWPVTFLAGLAAMVTLASRLHRSAGSDRFRLQVFAGGLLFGLSPLFVEVIIEESWPAYKALVHQPEVEPWIAVLLFVPMASVPLVVSYSVLYDRIVETRVVLRLAAQYLLAKATIIVLSAMPFVALAVFLYERRTESLVTLLGGPRPVALALFIVTGAVAFRLRRQWLRALDRRYFREAHDAHALLSHLMVSDWITQTPRAIAEALARELETAFHARADLYVLDPVPGDLCDPRGGGTVLNMRSTLAALVMASAQPMDVDTTRDTALKRIPASEQQWLNTGAYTLLVPLRTRAVDVIGVLALGPKRSELPYSDSDRRALMAIATPVALALDNSRLRSGPDSHTPPAAGECVSCSRVHQSGAAACVCGGEIVEAAAPYLLRGVFRFERRLGAGGMGVVYLARDLSLGRSVAIKTLPHVGSEHQARLQSEAQAMASLVDANLAVIYGIESWRGVPFLVEEYLEGGTLSWRLAGRPLGIGEAIDLGLTLTSALGRLHDAGIIHCDVKPSNIGFTRNGTPKLIDFGLAHMLMSSGDPLQETASIGRDAAAETDVTISTIITRHGLVGTPAYMSPEALLASKPEPSFDVWALSVVLFEALAGQRPFLGRSFGEVSLAIFHGHAPDIRELRPECGEQVAGFFARALSPSHAERPTTPSELQRELFALRAAVP
jgi:hypothetical protein